MLRIKLASLMVEDQEKALRFYTDVLGFKTKHDFPAGGARWITVVSPDREDLELVLEPNGNPAARAFQEAMFAQGIPMTSLESTDLEADHARLSAKGVAFTQPPTDAGPVKIAVFSDTVGNLIQLHQAM
jgi:glyoxylase I family protein